MTTATSYRTSQTHSIAPHVEIEREQAEEVDDPEEGETVAEREEREELGCSAEILLAFPGSPSA